MRMTEAISLVTRRGVQELGFNIPVRFLMNGYVVDGVIDTVNIDVNENVRDDYYNLGMSVPVVRRFNDSRIKVEISLVDGRISKLQEKDRVVLKV